MRFAALARRLQKKREKKCAEVIRGECVDQARAHPILIAAGAAVLLFSLLGMAAMAGIFI
jgi:hypothetical protein